MGRPAQFINWENWQAGSLLEHQSVGGEQLNCASQSHLDRPGAMLSCSDKSSQLVERKHLPTITLGQKPKLWSSSLASPHYVAAQPCPSRLPGSTNPQTTLGMSQAKTPARINQLCLFSPGIFCHGWDPQQQRTQLGVMQLYPLTHRALEEMQVREKREQNFTVSFGCQYL